MVSAAAHNSARALLRRKSINRKHHGDRNMWTCPTCKHKFVNRNQPHSCGNYTVDDFLRGKSVGARALFKSFISEYRTIGDFDLHPVKTRVALLTQMRFCSINRVGKDFIDVHLVLTRLYNDRACFYRTDNLADRFFIHHMKIHRLSDVNSRVRKYMKLAYDVGNRKHVTRKKERARWEGGKGDEYH